MELSKGGQVRRMGSNVMKRVLITGENSYIGTSVEKWLLKEPETFQVDTISVKGDDWKSYDFFRI